MARPKGSKNQKTIEVEMTAKRLGCDPFEILCWFANGDAKSLGVPEVPLEMRLHAAKEATAYIYSKKKTVEEETSDKILSIILEDYSGRSTK